MPNILIRCPALGRVVLTGLNTEKTSFASLSGIKFYMVCPACGHRHRWKQQNAWIEGQSRTGSGRTSNLLRLKASHKSSPEVRPT